MFAAAHCWPFSYVDAAVQPRVCVQVMSSCQSISSRRRKPCDPSFEDCQIRRSAITLQWRSIPATWVRPTIGRTDGPPTPYVGSQNVDFNIICRSNGFRAAAPSCLSCWKILVPIAALRGASPWPSPAVMHLASSPRQDARNCAGADTVSYVRAGCRDWRGRESSRLKLRSIQRSKTWAHATGGTCQEPAARWRFESRPLAFVVVTFKQVLGKAVLFSC
jgi:hypothetical protein